MRLVDGEELTFQQTESADSGHFSDDELNQKYVRGEIRIVTEQARYPLSTIADMIDSPNYMLSPEYQRRRRWDIERKSRLIESLIMNVPIPPIFLYEHEYSKYEVMDGLQRLSTIKDFYTNTFELASLTHWPELNGRTYSKLPEKLREGIDRRYLSSVILLKETAKSEEEALSLKQMVFERLNSGGARLTAQETRNAIYDGPLNQLCIKLSRTPSLCRLWKIPVPDQLEGEGAAEPHEERVNNKSFREMEDVELVLRFFAYRQKHELQKSANLTQYLDTFLRNGNHFSPEVLSQLEDIFTATINLIEKVFGEKAFWLYRSRKSNWIWYDRPTTTVYDPLMFIVSGYLNRVEDLLKKKTQITGLLEEFYKDNYVTFEGRSVNRSTLMARDAAFSSFFSELLK